MPRLPDRFDLWVRKARDSADPARQIDWILGALVALREVCFLNEGTAASPRIATAALATEECVLVFTDRDRIEELIAEHPASRHAPAEGPPVIASPGAAALKWCVESKAGLLINPGGQEPVMVPWMVLAAFFEEWQRGQGQPAGFWIPNMSTEEEDFWQEQGL